MTKVTTAVAGPNPTCEEWAGFAPGPELALQLASADLTGLSDDELTSMLGAARRQTSWTQSVELEAVAELSRRRYAAEDGLVSSETTKRLADEVSLALTVSTGAALGLVYLADSLTERLPETRKALRAGRIDAARAMVICDGLFGTSDQLAARVERTVIVKASAATAVKLRRLVRKALKDADPAAAKQRTRTARKGRRVELWNNASGTSDLTGRDMDADEASAIYNRLTAAAHAMKADGDVRGVDELRADLYAALLRGTPLPEAARNLRTAPAPEARDDRPDQGMPEGGGQGSSPHSGDRGDVPQFGGAGSRALRTSGIRAGEGTDTSKKRAQEDSESSDITAAVERQIAQGLARVTDRHLKGLLAQAKRAGRTGSRVALITQAVQAMAAGLEDIKNQWCQTAGQPQGRDPGKHGHDGYRPPAAMQRLIEQRHPTCVFPTCNRRSTTCDMDHTKPYHQGGVTCRCNLSPLCRRHHQAKQHHRWTLYQPWPGLLIWVTPAGIWHIVTPQ
ncbi:MAG: endonuclease [Actinomycetia bacterium]|nr:endonuclease [Actinomycetes bacterium]